MRMNAILILFHFIIAFKCYSQSIDSLTNQLIGQLQENNTNLIIEHRYWLLNGRFSIHYDQKNLKCDGVPGIYHVFWIVKDKMMCQRIDPCGLFQPIQMVPFLKESNIEKLKKDEIGFKPYSPHYTSHTLIVYQNGEILSWNLSGSQLKKESSDVIRIIKKIEKRIRKQEKNGIFIRIE